MKKDDLIEVKLPSSYAECADFSKLQKHSIGPGGWPEKIYAGRLLTIGELLNSLPSLKEK